MTDAVKGYKLRVTVHDGLDPGSFVELAGVVGCTPPPPPVAATAAADNLKSPSRTRETVAAMGEPGELIVRMQFTPGSETDAFILAWRTSGQRRLCWVDFGHGPSLGLRGFVTAYVPGEVLPGGLMSADLTCKAAGSPVPAARRLDFSRAVNSFYLAVL